MIPYSICNGQIYEKNQILIDFSIVDISVYHFTMRLPSLIELNNVIFQINFYQMDSSAFQSVQIAGQKAEIEENEFYVDIRIEVDNLSYQKLVLKLMKEYTLYIDCKTHNHLERISHDPFESDRHYPDNYEQFLLKPLYNLKITQNYGKEIQEIGICLQDYLGYQDYLNNFDYPSYYFQKLGLSDHPIASKAVNYLYVGNQGCLELFPTLEILNRIINKAKREKRKVIIVFPPIKENELGRVGSILERLDEIEEVVVNDFGMIEMLKKYPQFKVTAGVLLIKHKKDPRMNYKIGYQNNLYAKSNIHTDFYRNYLENQGVNRISIEATDHFFEPVENMDLYLPFYITNLATVCSIKAIEENHTRGKMITNRNCSHYCEKQHCLYPEHLMLIGKYNGLYGYDVSILEKGLENYTGCRNCRVILNF